MKTIYKLLPLNITASLLLTGCFSADPVFKNAEPEKVDDLPLKLTPISNVELKGWNQSDLALDTIPGMSVGRTYSELLQGKKGKTVIVAVVDSGIDINHEDLKGKIWTNKKERPGDGKDNDRNGYIDDVHGWNFLGDVVAENMEYTRIVRDYKDKFEGKTSVPAEDQKMFELYKAAKEEYAKEFSEVQQKSAQYSAMYTGLTDAHKMATEKLGKSDYSTLELLALETTTDTEKQNKEILLSMSGNVDDGENFNDFLEGFSEYVEYLSEREKTHFNFDLNARKALNDDENNISKKVYGNNKVGGPDPKLKDAKHGTHVAGIIAANRNNDIGMKGIAENVLIMPVRAVPDGDEYDKDIANGIRYAVDNGAKIINTSFGKYFSPHPEWVWDAIKYAASKDVLIVNAAGNENTNIDQKNVYPNDQTVANDKEVADNFLTVGALNYEYGTQMIAPFSNYGKKNVDVFAPGVKIYATTPLNNYEFMQGTSMAAPAVSGAAAVIRSYFPKLTAVQVKKVLMDSGNPSKSNVVLGDGTNSAFMQTSRSGKMVNLYNAFLLAQKL